MTAVPPSFFPVSSDPNASNIWKQTAMEDEASYIKATRQTAFLKKLFDFMPRAQLAWYEQTADSGLNQERVGESNYQDYRGKLSPAFWNNDKQFYQHSPEALVVTEESLTGLRGQYDEAAQGYNESTGEQATAILGSLMASGIINSEEEILRDPYKLNADQLWDEEDTGADVLREFGDEVLRTLKLIFARKSFSVNYDAKGTPRGAFRADGGLGIYDGNGQVYGHTDILDEVPDGAVYNAYGNTWAHNMNLYSGAASWNPFKAEAVEYADFESVDYLADLNNKFMSPLSALEGEVGFESEGQTTFAALNAKMLAIQNKNGGFVNPGNVDDEDTDLNWEGAIDPYKDNDIANFDINANYYTIAMANNLWTNFSDEEKFTFITHAWEARKRGYKGLRDIMGRWFDQPVALTYDNEGEWTEANKSIGDFQKLDDIMRKAYGVTGKMGQWHQDVKDKLKNPIFSVPFNLLAESTHPLALMLDSWGYWGADKGQVFDAAFEYNKLDFVQEMTLGYARYINQPTSTQSTVMATVSNRLTMTVQQSTDTDTGVLGDIADILNPLLPNQATSKLKIPMADETEEEIFVNDLFSINSEISTVENIDETDKEEILEDIAELNGDLQNLRDTRDRYDRRAGEAWFVKTYGGTLAYGILKEALHVELGRGLLSSRKDPIVYWTGKVDDKNADIRAFRRGPIAEAEERLAEYSAQYAAVYNKLRKIYDVSFDMFESLTGINLTTGGKGANTGTTAVADGSGRYAIYEKLTGDAAFSTGNSSEANELVQQLRVVLAKLEPLVGLFDPSIDTDSVSKLSPNREQSRTNSAGNVLPGNTLLRVLIDNQGSSEYTGLVKPDGVNYRLEVDFVPHSMQSAQAPIEDSDAEIAIERNVYEQVRTLDGMAAIPGMIQTNIQANDRLNRVYLPYGIKGRAIGDVYYEAGSSNYRSFENYTDPENVVREYVYADKVFGPSDKGPLYRGEGIMGGLFNDPRDPARRDGDTKKYLIRGNHLDVRENIARAWYTYLGRAELDLAQEYIDNMTVNTVFYDQWLIEREEYEKVMEAVADKKLADIVAENNSKEDDAMEAKNKARSAAQKKRDAWLSVQKIARKKKEK
jgi:hypothetical protein